MNCKIFLFGLLSLFCFNTNLTARNVPFASELDTLPIKERLGDHLTTKKNPFDLKDPSLIQKTVEYDEKTGQYIIYEKIGDDFYRAPTYLTFKEYLAYKDKTQQEKQFQKLNGLDEGKKSRNPLGLKADDPLKKLQEQIEKNIVDRLFGGTEISIVPTGNIDIDLGAGYTKQKNPQLNTFNQVNIRPIFDMNINVNVEGNIGEKMKLRTSFNNKAAFNFDNVIKLNYDTPGFSEDEIIKDIGAGNVALPLKGTLIQGASSLFGLKLGTQFGKLKVTTVVAQQQSRRQQISIQQGGQSYKFQLSADQYDENRHFFFTQSNRDNYEKALENIPQINSLFNITYLEVWVTNDRTETQNVRDIIAFTDLGEPTRTINPKLKKSPQAYDINGKPLPSNGANELFANLLGNTRLRNIDGAIRELTKKGGEFEMQPTKDFEKVRARKLRSDEFTYDPKLGFISVNFQLRPNQTLGVAFTYKYNGKEFKVGELSNNSPSADVRFDKTKPVGQQYDTIPQMLFVKLLKATTPRLGTPLWDLMMKNIYSLGASNLNKEGFRLEIMYNKPGDGERRFIPDTKVAGKPLLQIFNLDKLNIQGDPQPDGVFDFVEGVTVNTRQGKIIFPVLEPFGKALAKSIGDPLESRRYVYQQLYDTTITAAREFPELNVFSIKGQYKGTSNSEYQLGTFNLPKGSVKVQSGTTILVEDVDYTVNYGTGTVKILNEAYVNSAVPVSVSFEDSQLFGFQQKRMLGTRWDYLYNKNLTFGGTMMKLWEVPFTQKVNVGEDPINNNVYGFDINYNKDVPWVTKLADRLPFYSTKAPSSFSFTAEAAVLRPGHAKYIDKLQNEKTEEVFDTGGIVYIDDFEGSTNGTDLRQPNQWFLASIPQNDLENNNPRFPESSLINSTLSNVNRAKLAWYNINEQSGNSLGGSSGVVRNEEDGSNPYFGFITDQEIFPVKDNGNGLGGTFPARIFDLTYIPQERGPYNYDLPNGGTAYSKGLNSNGGLENPETRWAGIMRALPYNDFEASNVEFMDFWVLSPYLVDGASQKNKGVLHVDLGNISEDILRDSRQAYENGLPGGLGAANRFPTDKTAISRVPRIAPITNAFDLDNAIRSAQDVGLDGFNNDAERIHFAPYLATINNANNNLNPAARARITADPSNDDFAHFLDQRYNSNSGVRGRYFDFNNTENNSQPTGNSSFATSSTNIPDSEDLDNNKSLDNEGESYFHYEVPIEFGGFADNIGGLDVNKAGFVSDIIRVDPGVKKRWAIADHEPVFYRIRIPIDKFKKKVGGIQDFRSIRFMRIYMTGFKDEITLRFGRMDLARSQWRRYKRSKWAGPNLPIVPGVDPAKDNTSFDINSINFEENGNRPLYKYVLPPGVKREQLTGQASTIATNQNEQAISMSVCNLQESAERGMYKISNLQLNLYKHLKMFVHAEPKLNGTPIANGELTAFIRMGNDFEKNYYEYEVPLVMSDTAVLKTLVKSSDNYTYAKEIWRPENNFDIDIEKLIALKTERNSKKASFEAPYVRVAANGKDSMTVVGNPNFTLVKGILIGIRNRSSSGRPLCAEVWVNELRATGFDERSGAAALARAEIKVADLGRVTMSGNFSGIGYGPIENRLQQRNREQVLQYDLNTNVELGKFFPDKLGVKIPFTYQFSNNIRTPEYDPYDLDVKFKDKLAAAGSRAERDSIRKQGATFDKISNISFDNVRIEKQGNSEKKPMPWNLSNFSVSYQQSENAYSDPIIESEKKKLRRGELDYNYAIPGGLSVTPFKKLIKNDKYLKLLSEFNFSPLPSNISFNSNLERQVNTTKYRFTEGFDSLSTYFNKRFLWDRKYTLNWDFSKGIKMTYNSDVTSVVDEPRGLIDTQTERDSIFKNIKNLGRYKTFAQNVGLNYTLPTRQIPFMEWVTVKAQANATYNWNAAALNTQFLGNTIRNTQNRQINGDFNFEQLYNQWKYLKKINTPLAAKVKTKKTKTPTTGDKNSDPSNPRTGDSPSDNSTKGRDGGDSRNADVQQPEDQRSRLREKLRQAKTDGKIPDPSNSGAANKDGKTEDAKTADAKGGKKKKEKEPKEYEPSQAERILIRPLMLLRNASASYSENYQNTVPGFMPNTGILGQDNFTSPGWGFIVGETPSDQWLEDAAKNNWITKSNLLNESVVRNYTQQFQGKVKLEPFTDFKIDVDISKNFTKNRTEDFKDSTGKAEPFYHLAPREVGSFTISYFSLKGLFGKDTIVTNQLYEDYNLYTKVISERLAGPNAKKHDKDVGYFTGYGRTNAQVAIPAFMAAYTGRDPNTVNLNIFKTMPLPNYRLTYNGLGKLPALKDKVQSISISHGYKSQLQLNSYNTNTPDYDRTNEFRKDPVNKNYYSELNIPGVVLNREFSPLIGIDIKMKNDMTLRLDMKKRYNLQMSFIDSQLSEQKQDDYSLTFGYKMKNVHLKFLDFMNFDQNNKKKDDGEKKKSIIKFKSQEDDKNAKPELDKNGKPIKKKKVKKGNDLTMNCGIALVNGVTYQTNLITGLRVPVRGDLTLKISPSADYVVNKQLTLRFFMDYQQFKPKTSLSIPRTEFKGGVTLRFQLQ